MVYNYEAAVLKYLMSLVPGIEYASYADDESIFRQTCKITKYPSLWYTRDSTEWNLSVQLKQPNAKGAKTQLMKFTQTYAAHFVVETQGKALSLASSLRAKLFDKNHVTVEYSEGTLNVAMFITSLQIVPQRGSYDTKGSQREVVLKWWSQLFFEESDEVLTPLVTGFRIYLDKPNGDHSLHDDKLITEYGDI